MRELFSAYAVSVVPMFNLTSVWLVNRRRKPVWVVVILIVLSFAIGAVLPRMPFIYKSPFLFVLGAIPLTIVNTICFEGTIFQNLFIGLSSVNIGVYAGYALAPLAQLCAPYGSDDYYMWLMIFMAAFQIIEVALCATGLRGSMAKLFTVQRKGWWLLAVSTVLSRLILSSIIPTGNLTININPPEIEHGGLAEYYVVVFASIWCFASVFGVAVVIYLRSRAAYELRASSDALAASRKYFAALSESLATARRIDHDGKYERGVVVNLAREGNCAEILKFLNSRQEKAQPRRFCAHTVINALLGWYAARFETEEISFDADVALPDDIAADPDELCVLFGNLLENALEGCLTASDERFVKISAKTSGTELAVVIVNSFDGVVRRDGTRDENLLSRKENGGMGIQSINAVCKKYGGVYIPSWTHARFTAHALLNLREDAGQ